MQNLLGPWCISGPAIEIGKKALRDDTWVHATRASLDELSKRQAAMMIEAGLECPGVNPLFIFAKHPKAKLIYRALAQQKILVRPFSKISDHLRFGLCKDESELLRLKSTLNQVLGELR